MFVALLAYVLTGGARLKVLPGGKLALNLKTPWRDGTVGIVLTGVQLVARLARPSGSMPSAPDDTSA